MAAVDLAKKYSNFIAPKNQIIVDKQDILQIYHISASTITVEDSEGNPPNAAFTFQDPTRSFIGSGLFDLGKSLEVKMGYANLLEPVFNGKITSTKTIFPKNEPPQIQVFGTTEKTNLPLILQPTCCLAYAKEMYSFTATTAEAFNVCCNAESVGLPDLKVGVIAALTGLGTKFSGNYRIRKTVHLWDDFNFRTQFEGVIVAARARFFEAAKQLNRS